MSRPTFLCQPGQNRQAAQCAILEGREHREAPARDVVPIGSVEWTREYARAVGVTLPDFPTYPAELSGFLGRTTFCLLFDGVPEHWFVKPVAVKAFTGGIKSELTEPVKSDRLVWASEPVAFTAEWRCYVLRGEIVGVGQYGEGDDAELDQTMPRRMVEAWPSQPAGWALDVGRLSDGRIVLVEANDGWALGYYRGCDRRAYLDVIAARWAELAARAAGEAP